MLTVACVLKSGGIYDWTWVARLRNGVAKHLPMEYRFVCLSDVAVPCTRTPLYHDWPGWWSKIEAFRLLGPVLYFDLDTVIVGDLSDIAATANREEFVMLRDFYAPEHVGSGVMSWRGDEQNLYDQFELDPDAAMAKRRTRMGDQAFIEEWWGNIPIAKWQDEHPGQVLSYKLHCQNGIPDDARVICLHGRPKFADMPVNNPVRVAWEVCA